MLFEVFDERWYALMEARIEGREFAFERTCDKLLGGLRVSPLAAKEGFARFFENRLLALCAQMIERGDRFLEPVSPRVFEVLIMAPILHFAFVDKDQM